MTGWFINPDSTTPGTKHFCCFYQRKIR